MSIKTYTPSCKTPETERKWFLIDAENVVLGRLASTVAMILRGKHKATFTPHNDGGDHVVIINVEKVYLTGKKNSDKIYYHHTGFPGGLKQRTAEQILKGKYPERVIEKAVKRMLPDGSLARKVLKKLHCVTGPEHPYAAQKPEVFAFSEKNPKNKKRGA